MLAALVQPLSANDLVAIGAMLFGGTVLIIRALKDKPTAADAKADALGDQLKTATDQIAAMQASLTTIALHTPVPAKTTTTIETTNPATKTTTTTDPVVNQAKTDTLPLDTPAIKPTK